MNILGTVTRRYLVKNKTRTLVTIIGIILSAAMITAVTTIISSLQAYMYNYAVYTDGDWHGCLYEVPEDQIESVLSDSQVESGAVGQIVGYSYIETDNTDKPYLYILGGDQLFFDRMPVHLTQGSLPETPDEIILPEHIYTYGGQLPEIGAQITIDVGRRVSEGYYLSQSNPLTWTFDENGEEVVDEAIEDTHPRTYTVVGYYQRPGFEDFRAPGYTALTCLDSTLDGYTAELYFKMNDPKATFDFVESQPYAGSANSDVLMFLGASRYDTFYTVLYGLGAILICLIIFGSVSLIYNAFSISVSERTRDFGLLSSIGATKKQIRHMVFSEATTVSVIGIPLGVLAGILGIGVTLHFIGGNFAALFSSGFASGMGAIELAVSWPAIIIACVLAFITVLISAWIPSKRATKITAIEAIRQSGDISIKPREVRTSPLTYRLFGLEGAIASKHFKRNRRRYRATVISLFMSVVLFISASSFCRYLTDSVMDVFMEYDYDIHFEWADDEQLTSSDSSQPSPEELTSIFTSVDEVTGYNLVSSMSCDVPVSVDIISDELAELYSGSFSADRSQLDELFSDNTVTVFGQIYGITDEYYRSYLEEHGLDTEKFMDSASPTALIVPSVSFFNRATQRQEVLQVFHEGVDSFTALIPDNQRMQEFHSSDTSDLTSEEYNRAYYACYDQLEIDIGGTVQDLPLGLNTARTDYIIILYPMSVFRQISDQFENASVSNCIYLTTNDHTAAMENLESAAEENGIHTGNFQDVRELGDMNMSLVTIIQVFSYGFIALISLISVANVFNTISTNINLRRREFAMLKSVGETSKGFNKMMNYECLLYGSKALIFGIPVAFGITYLIFRSVNSGLEVSFYLPWAAVAIAVGSVFLVVFATMMYAMRKIKKDNPIDALKSENI